MKTSIEYPNYRLHNDKLYKMTNGRLTLAPVSIVMHKDGQRKMMRYSDVVKLFTIDSDEQEPTSEESEKWRFLEGREWIEVSTLGRCRVEGSIVKPELCKRSNQMRILAGRRTKTDSNYYQFTLWTEVIKFKYPDYEHRKCKFLDGNKENVNIDNLEDYRDAKYYFNKHKNELAKKHIPDSRDKESCPMITIKQRELDSLIEFNSFVNEEVLKLRAENEKLKRRIEIYK